MKTLQEKLQAFYGMAPYGNCQVTYDGYFASSIIREYSPEAIKAACAALGKPNLNG